MLHNEYKPNRAYEVMIIYYDRNFITSYMFQPLFVAMFREELHEVCITAHEHSSHKFSKNNLISILYFDIISLIPSSLLQSALQP
jgi:hypothetical protein